MSAILFDDNRPPLHDDPWVAYALNEIQKTYGDRCIANRKSLFKFGRNKAVGSTANTQYPINSWGEFEIYQSSNVTLKISSSSPSDTVTVTFEYMTISGGNLTFGSDTVTLNGQSKVDLPVAAVRWTRAYTTDNVTGTIYFYRDGAITAGVPDDLTTIHITIPAGANQSQKAATSISSTNYLILTHWWSDMIKNTSGAASVSFAVKPVGSTNFRLQPVRGVASGHSLDYYFKPFLIIPPNYDVEVWAAAASGATNDVTAGFNGVFADIKS